MSMTDRCGGTAVSMGTGQGGGWEHRVGVPRRVYLGGCTCTGPVLTLYLVLTGPGLTLYLVLTGPAWVSPVLASVLVLPGYPRYWPRYWPAWVSLVLACLFSPAWLLYVFPSPTWFRSGFGSRVEIFKIRKYLNARNQ